MNNKTALKVKWEKITAPDLGGFGATCIDPNSLPVRHRMTVSNGWYVDVEGYRKGRSNVYTGTVYDDRRDVVRVLDLGRNLREGKRYAETRTFELIAERQHSAEQVPATA